MATTVERVAVDVAKGLLAQNYDYYGAIRALRVLGLSLGAGKLAVDTARAETSAARDAARAAAIGVGLAYLATKMEVA